MEREVEDPDKGWLSHDQIFQYSWRIFLQLLGILISAINFPNILENLVMRQAAIARASVHHMLRYRGPGNEAIPAALGLAIQTSIHMNFES